MWTPIRIANVGTGYDGQYVVSNKVDSTNIQYKVQSSPDDPLPTIANATANVSVDTVTSASPYIFNLSLRSVYGMCGMLADGDKATGFKSMVLAQFTGIGLQKDNNAFVKYNSSSGTYEDKTATGNSNLESDSRARYKPSYANFHIKSQIIQYCKQFPVLLLVMLIILWLRVVVNYQLQTLTLTLVLMLSILMDLEGMHSLDDVGYIGHIIPPKVNNNPETDRTFLH